MVRTRAAATRAHWVALPIELVQQIASQLGDEDRCAPCAWRRCRRLLPPPLLPPPTSELCAPSILIQQSNCRGRRKHLVQTCTAWCAAIEAAPELWPVSVLRVDSSTEDAVQRLFSQARQLDKHALRVRLEQPAHSANGRGSTTGQVRHRLPLAWVHCVCGGGLCHSCRGR